MLPKFWNCNIHHNSCYNIFLSLCCAGELSRRVHKSDSVQLGYTIPAMARAIPARPRPSLKPHPYTILLTSQTPPQREHSMSHVPFNWATSQPSSLWYIIWDKAIYMYKPYYVHVHISLIHLYVHTRKLFTYMAQGMHMFALQQACHSRLLFITWPLGATATIVGIM